MRIFMVRREVNHRSEWKRILTRPISTRQTGEHFIIHEEKSFIPGLKQYIHRLPLKSIFLPQIFSDGTIITNIFFRTNQSTIIVKKYDDGMFISIVWQYQRPQKY